MLHKYVEIYSVVYNRILCSRQYIYFAMFLNVLEGGMGHPIFLSALDVSSPFKRTETSNDCIPDITCNKFLHPLEGGTQRLVAAWRLGRREFHSRLGLITNCFLNTLSYSDHPLPPCLRASLIS